jgi:hypothetical protein
MTPAEVAAFLSGKRRAVVGTLDAHGAPDGEPAEFAWADGVATVAVARGGPVHGNLLRDARVVCSLEEFPSYGEIRGVTLHGRAAWVAESETHARFRIEAARVESFDFRKMRQS